MSVEHAHAANGCVATHHPVFSTFKSAFFAVRRSPMEGHGRSAYSTTMQSRSGSPNPQRTPMKENDMNVLKNMEAIFLAALVLAGMASYATAAIPAHLQPATRVMVGHTAVGGQQMAVVTVTAKRLSAAEKARM
jgi:hypothetical protein